VSYFWIRLRSVLAATGNKEGRGVIPNTKSRLSTSGDMFSKCLVKKKK